mmetsp:Transcript_61650/g.133498  ORF Transcript_61650/g.133498 Transcript_61650/m.133498 type:complete len:444 (+) Transcript_61650:71-1402(+)
MSPAGKGGVSSSPSTELRPSSPSLKPDERCAVCWGLLCEPVAWPGCTHSFCLVCALRTRHRPKPVCPLCRTAAVRVPRSTDLRVDVARASQVRRSVGYSRYEARRRGLWAEAAAVDASTVILELPLCRGGPSRFPAGTQLQLRFLEPRYREMARRAFAPGGTRRFVLVLQPAEFEAGAKGRVCEIVEGSQASCGEWRVTIRGGAACQLLEVKSEEVEAGAEPLFHGELEEVEEDELADSSEDLLPLIAATEVADILGSLGRQLRAMRRRRLMMAIAGFGEDLFEETPAGDPVQIQVQSAGPAEPPETAGESTVSLDGIGAMLHLLVAYRQIIGQMDQLLTEASDTAGRLSLAQSAEQAEAETQTSTPSASQTPSRSETLPALTAQPLQTSATPSRSAARVRTGPVRLEALRQTRARLGTHIAGSRVLRRTQSATSASDEDQGS